MTSEAWAIVAATALGPIAAVCITLWREAVADERKRRLHVFRTLMSTRRMVISNEHVNALNLVEVDFYGCPDVQSAWKVYKDHLFDNEAEQANHQKWAERGERLLAKMLFEIGKVLGYEIPAMEIFQGGYAPQGWQFRDNQGVGALAYLNDLANGKKVLPVALCETPNMPVASDLSHINPLDGVSAPTQS